MTTPGERVKKIRKQLNLTLENFGERLGVAKTTISRIETGVNKLTEQMAKAICREYDVNYEYLMNDKGDPFNDTPQNILDELCKHYRCDDFDRNIILEYLKLNDDDKKVVKEYIRNVAMRAAASDPGFLIPDTPEELEKLYPPVDIEEIKSKAK